MLSNKTIQQKHETCPQTIKQGGMRPTFCSVNSVQFSSVQSVMSNALRPQGVHAARKASLSITNHQSFKQTHVHWVGDAIQPSLSSPSPPTFNLSQHQGLLNESALPIRWPKYWSFSFSISPSNKYSGLISVRMDWWDLLAVQGTLKSLLQHHSSKASILWHSAFFIEQLSHPYMTTGKTVSLIRQTFVSKVMSMLFNMLSRLVITFLPRSKCLLISRLQSPSAVILETSKIKSVTVSIVSTSICHEVMGPDAMILAFWMLGFKPTFSLSSFTFSKWLYFFPFCHKGGVICISEVLICLPAILIPACASSRPVFLVMYSAYKLNKQHDNIQPWHTPFPIWNQSVFPCPVLTVASWPAYRFLQRQVKWSVIPIFEEFSTVCCDWHSQSLWHSHKAEVDVFLELSFLLIQQILAIWALVLLPYLNPVWTSGSSWFIYCWSLTWKILSITSLACEMSAIMQ